jgi:hypothetical protein
MAWLFREHARKVLKRGSSVSFTATSSNALAQSPPGSCLPALRFTEHQALAAQRPFRGSICQQRSDRATLRVAQMVARNSKPKRPLWLAQYCMSHRVVFRSFAATTVRELAAFVASRISPATASGFASISGCNRLAPPQCQS